MQVELQKPHFNPSFYPNLGGHLGHLHLVALLLFLAFGRKLSSYHRKRNSDGTEEPQGPPLDPTNGTLERGQLNWTHKPDKSHMKNDVLAEPSSVYLVCKVTWKHTLFTSNLGMQTLWVKAVVLKLSSPKLYLLCSQGGTWSRAEFLKPILAGDMGWFPICEGRAAEITQGTG